MDPVKIEILDKRLQEYYSVKRPGNNKVMSGRRKKKCKICNLNLAYYFNNQGRYCKKCAEKNNIQNLERLDTTISEIGARRGFMTDVMFEKSPNRTLKCNVTDEVINTLDIKNNPIQLQPGYCEPLSNKLYNDTLHGPRTHDAQGVDSFPEGSEIIKLYNGEQVKLKSRGRSKSGNITNNLLNKPPIFGDDSKKNLVFTFNRQRKGMNNRVDAGGPSDTQLDPVPSRIRLLKNLSQQL